MQNRKDQLLKGIVDIHVASAAPVGSQALLDHCGLEVSSATVRNDLKALEEAGYVHQPHTSAGRVPTAKAYRHYVEHYLGLDVPQELVEGAQKIAEDDEMRKAKLFARLVADELGQAVFVVFSREQLYYTGLTNLFSKPEFADQGTVQNVTRLLDRFDEVVHELFGMVESQEMHLHIGPGNPFGDACTVMHIPFAWSDGKERLFGVLGPTRMNYNQTIATMKLAKQYLQQM